MNDTAATNCAQARNASRFVELRGFEPLTPCMPCHERHSRYQLRPGARRRQDLVELRGFEPLTPCMPCPERHRRYQLRPGARRCTHWVELRGFEPLTPCMPCKCATNCATAPIVAVLGNAGNLIDGRRAIANRGAWPATVVLYDDSRSRPAPCSASTAQPQLCIDSKPPAVDERPAEEAGEGDPERGAVRHDHGRLPLAEALEELLERRDDRAPRRPRRSRRRGPRRGRATSHQPSNSVPEALTELLAGSGRCAPRGRTPADAASSTAVSPVAFSRNAAVSRARARSLLTSRAGSSAASTAAIASAWPAPGVVEADVGVALRAALGVPRGLAVPDEDEPATASPRRRQPISAATAGGRRRRASGSPGSRARAARGRRTRAPRRAARAPRSRRSRSAPSGRRARPRGVPAWRRSRGACPRSRRRSTCTWRSLLAEQSRNASVITSCSLTSKARMFSASLSEAARAAVCTSSMAWSVAVMQVLPLRVEA